jgi:hypothetical protein
VEARIRDFAAYGTQIGDALSANDATRGTGVSRIKMAGNWSARSASSACVSVDAERPGVRARAQIGVLRPAVSKTRKSDLNVQMSIEKRLALKLVRHAAFVLPRPLSSWGAAMRHEIEYIQPSRDALKWAVGCVSSSYGRRIASLNVVQVALIRWLLIGLIASWAIDDLFATRWLYLKAAAWLGLGIEGSDAAKFITALDALPSWSIVLDAASSLFYIVAVYCLTRKKASTLWVLVAGTAVNCIACVSQVMVVIRAYGAPLSEEVLRRTCFTYALHIFVILLLWYGFARDRRRAST